MTKRRTLKHRKSLRHKRSKSSKSSGGGWSDLPKGTFNQIAVNPGNQIHFPFTGPGKDCTGNPHSIRPGYVTDYTSKGLPGLSGGKHHYKRRHKNRKSYGGASMPPPASTHFGEPITNPNLPPVSGSVTPKPVDFPDTTGGAGQTHVTMSMPGVPVNGQPLMEKMPMINTPPQKGGRYGFFPDMGPLNPVNGVGTSPAPFGRIPCESGTYNPLNPNPGGIQTMTTAPLIPPYVTRGGASGFSSANFPTVQVGQADSMRYYAPTAGYRNDFMTFPAPSAVPGLTIQTPYDARAFNQACIKTGGTHKRRRSHRKGGAGPVAFDAGKFTPVTMSEIGNRSDFDGTNKGLPVKFGGKRRSHRRSHRTRRVLKRKSHKKH